MSQTKWRRSRTRPGLVPRIKVWLEIDGRYAFGFGLSEILQAVDAAGSIKEAASDLGKSYRYIWGRIKKAEKVLRHRLVETQVGGKGSQRSFLTSFARGLVADFLTVRQRMMEAVQQESNRFIWPDSGSRTGL